MTHARLLTAVLLLVSCSPKQPAAESAPQDRTAPAATPAPAPAEPAPAAGNSKSQPLTAEGWGPLRIGMSRAEVVAAVGPDSNPQAVGGPNPDSCEEFFPARAPKDMLVMIENGRLTRISLVKGATLKTGRGLGLGTSPAAVRSAYGDALVAEPHKYVEAPGEYLTIWSGARPSPTARDPSARGLRYVIDTNGQVAAIHAGSPSIEYVEGCL